jgi:hypothetical protein
MEAVISLIIIDLIKNRSKQTDTKTLMLELSGLPAKFSRKALRKHEP